MLSIIILIIILILMLAISMFVSKHYLLTPELGLLTGFTLALMGCLANAERWNLNFSWITVEVMLSGFIVILIVSLISKTMFKINKTLFVTHQNINESEIYIHRCVLIVWTVVSIINLIFVARFLLINTGSLSLQIAINTYRESIYLTGDAESLPFFTRIVRSMCIYSGYMFLYLLFYNVVNKIRSKNNVYFLINIGCAAISSLLIGGSRGSLLQYIIAGITMYFALYSFKKYKIFSVKQVIRVLFVLGIFVLLFGQLSTWIGRGEVENLEDTIFTYLSGGVANLDTYLTQNGNFQFEQNYTFAELINSYYRITGQSYRQYRGLLANVYMTHNGVVTGNVYTMFASFYHDGGMIGVIFYSALMALLGQWIFSLSIKHHKNGKINISLIVYGYLFFDLVQCNFSNRFYSRIFSDNMIKFIAFLIVFKFVLTMQKIKFRYRIDKGGIRSYV